MAALLAGCSLRQTFRPELHTVARGETLYSIAWDYGVKWQNLARWNDIDPPYTIYPGQELTLDPYGPVRAESPSSDKAEETTRTTRRQPAASPTPAPTPTPPASRPRPEGWRWPAGGAVLRAYTGGESLSGIDIGGKTGDTVHAAQAGRVVYSGTGLKGYGNLVIIKHDEQFLSAYGYNRKLLVEQGRQVEVGEAIAEMGVGPNQQPALHFEVRRDGAPINPREVLPPR
ncbi:peptidoglycan DD-metalloendopeptidase family protein [Salinisphaera sp. P385]|uniref:Peptidoglycan DD-metalloendopeptidase family protein n=1 Tax=Spectribacter acetivorans TaxID=3075603 RepID=A0ABU3B4G7_9GAMM|nr:peptidoglycan DD-metalloendopeptidase family protein [Salinisphaera sp. P385]MDT0617349.1 peptidoglycan DD-metalloendopeptidase family protein [Salinisphaera sp. P385]